MHVLSEFLENLATCDSNHCNMYYLMTWRLGELAAWRHGGKPKLTPANTHNMPWGTVADCLLPLSMTSA